jgi:hypothetical protein
MDSPAFRQLLETREYKVALSRVSTLDSAYFSSGSSAGTTLSRGGTDLLY